VSKRQFGDLLRKAREEKAYSLRQLADRVGIDYSRLAKIEGGTRPAPGLTEVRRLSEALEVEMVDLLVAAGTSREVVEHLLWSERLQADPSTTVGAHLPKRSSLLEKNTYRVRTLDREGALCTVVLGRVRVRVFSFSDAWKLMIRIPPEAVTVTKQASAATASSAENVLPMRVKKVRRLGQVTNLVLVGDGFELNTLHSGRVVDRMKLAEGSAVHAAIQATAILTEPLT